MNPLQLPYWIRPLRQSLQEAIQSIEWGEILEIISLDFRHGLEWNSAIYDVINSPGSLFMRFQYVYEAGYNLMQPAWGDHNSKLVEHIARRAFLKDLITSGWIKLNRASRSRACKLLRALGVHPEPQSKRPHIGSQNHKIVFQVSFNDIIWLIQFTNFPLLSYPH